MAIRTAMFAGAVSALLAVSMSFAQQTEPLPILDVAAEPMGPLDPDPCFEFACFDGAAFHGKTLAARGATYAAIYVFKRNASGALVHQATLKNPNPPIIVNVRPDQPDPAYVERTFGVHLALHGNDLFASSLWYDETNPQLPAKSETHVFRRLGNQWRHVQTLDGAGLMALQHGTALIAGTDSVRVFRRWGSQYVPEAMLPIPAAAATISSIALHGNIAVAGVAGTESEPGKAFIYHRFGWHWLYWQTLASADNTEPSFGSSVATDGKSIVVGAPDATAPISETRGVVYAFTRAGWKWRRTAIIEDPLAYEPDIQGIRTFGTDVDVEGKRLLVTGFNTYPFAQEPLTHLFHLRRGEWQPSAHIWGAARDLTISGRSALVDVGGLRFGTFPAIYDLPPAR